MCYHASFNASWSDLQDFFFLDKQYGEEVHALFHANAFAFPKIPVITEENPNKLQFFEWGLLEGSFNSPKEAKAFRMKYPTFNAVSETIFEKRMFQKPILNKRCIIPCTGFFEWREVQGAKYPYFINVKDKQNGKPSAFFSLAGIYNSWVDKGTGEVVNSFSILTNPANRMMELIHNSKKRMPLILPHGKEKEWLDKSLDNNPDEIKGFFSSFPEDQMLAYPISKRITSRKDNPNVPEVTDYHHYLELEGLEEVVFGMELPSS